MVFRLPNFERQRKRIPVSGSCKDQYLGQCLPSSKFSKRLFFCVCGYCCYSWLLFYYMSIMSRFQLWVTENPTQTTLNNIKRLWGLHNNKVRNFKVDWFRDSEIPLKIHFCLSLFLDTQWWLILRLQLFVQLGWLSDITSFVHPCLLSVRKWPLYSKQEYWDSPRSLLTHVSGMELASQTVHRL